MAWWPFGRKKRKDKKTKTSPGDAAVEERDTSLSSPPPRHSAASPPPPQTPAAQAKQEPPQTPGSPPYEDAPEDFFQASRPTTATAKAPSRKSSVEDITALPTATEVQRSPHLRPVPEQAPIPQASLLSSKRSTTDPAYKFGKKPSKRKRNDPIREEQIRAATDPIPIPKRALGDPFEELRRASRQSNRDFHLDSTVSLPKSPSLRSAMSGMSDQRLEFGPLELFSARPRLRYSLTAQASSGAIRSLSSRAESKQPMRPLSGADSRDVDEDTIDRLADSYDTTTIRQLMERDQRRRERKKKDEEDRARRRLERLAAKAESAEKGDPGPSKRTDSAKVSRKSSKREDKDKDSRGDQKDDPSTPQRTRKSKGKKKSGRSRTESEGRRSFATSEYGAGSERSFRTAEGPRTPLPGEEPIIGLADVVRYSRGGTSAAESSVPPVPPMPVLTDIPRPAVPVLKDITQSQPRSQSVSQEQPPDTKTSTEPSRSASDAGKRPGAIASFFRRSLTGKSKPESRSPEAGGSKGTFSNVSRESSSKQAIPAHLQGGATTLSRASSGTPSRTKSRFREDLPETPPTNSRVGSPEIPESGIAEPQSAVTAETLESHDASLASGGLASNAPLSQSFASVDSEASWLSGRPRKRTSQQMPSTALSERPEERSRSFEDLDEPDDQYFRRLTPKPDERSDQPGGISKGLASSRGEVQAANEQPPEAAERISEGDVALRPRVVHQQQRIKSNEGLLNQFEEDRKSTAEGDQSSVYDDSDNPDYSRETAEIAEAASMGIQHARTVSGGSAKLLEIPKRSSLRLKGPPDIPKRSSQRFSSAKPGAESQAATGEESPTHAGAQSGTTTA